MYKESNQVNEFDYNNLHEDEVNIEFNIERLKAHIKTVINEVKYDIINGTKVKQDQKKLVYMETFLEYLNKYNNIDLNAINNFIVCNTDLGVNTCIYLSRKEFGIEGDYTAIDNVEASKSNVDGVDFIIDDYTPAEKVSLKNNYRRKALRDNIEYNYF